MCWSAGFDDKYMIVSRTAQYARFDDKSTTVSEVAQCAGFDDKSMDSIILYLWSLIEFFFFFHLIYKLLFFH